METIYKDSANEDLVVFHNIEDAHGSSIQTVAFKMKELICDEENKYVDDLENLLERAEEIAKMCDLLKSACKGKKVEVYKIVK